MSEILARVGQNLVDRVSGPMHFRVYLQPVMATVFAVLDGLNDARLGKPSYFWSLVNDPVHRSAMVSQGWRSIGKVFILAAVLDVVYQFIEQRFVYPGEVVLVAIILAIMPYLILRGLVTRIAAKPPNQ
jgi:hypothetical protein